jgi:hypothetical protein
VVTATADIAAAAETAAAETAAVVTAAVTGRAAGGTAVAMASRPTVVAAVLAGRAIGAILASRVGWIRLVEPTEHLIGTLEAAAKPGKQEYEQHNDDNEQDVFTHMIHHCLSPRPSQA